MQNTLQTKTKNNLVSPFDLFDPFEFFKTSGNDLLGFDTFTSFDKPLKQNPSYPPYNITQSDDGSEYTITMAVAGLNKDDIDVTVRDGFLHVEYEASDRQTENKGHFIYEGIAKRAFRTKFRLPKNSEISDCALTNGMLSITIQKTKSEEDDVKRIEIK